MDTEQLKERYLPLLKRNWIPLLLGLIGLLLLSYGLISLLSSNEKDTVVIEKSEDNNVSSKIKVDVEGAVVKPGVYELDNTARIQDALIAAGGFSALADRTIVSKKLNLASKLVDGSKIYIPQKGEETILTSSGSVEGAININSATAEQLDTLSGIGPTTAEKIINLRPYSSLEDLVTKKAVSQKVFDSIKDKISL